MTGGKSKGNEASVFSVVMVEHNTTMVRRIRGQIYRYRAILAEDGDAFHAFVPSLHGCHTFGDLEEEVLPALREAAQVHVESLWFDHQPIPPSDADAEQSEYSVEVLIPWATISPG